MTLTRHSSCQDLNNHLIGMKRLLAPSVRPSGEREATAFAPPADISETENAVTLHLEIPGMTEEQIDLQISEDNVLTVRGEKSLEKTEEGKRFIRVERSHGTFVRSWKLPGTINRDAAAANYRDGVLTVRLPKREELKPQRIKVQIGKA